MNQVVSSSDLMRMSHSISMNSSAAAPEPSSCPAAKAPGAMDSTISVGE